MLLSSRPQLRIGILSEELLQVIQTSDRTTQRNQARSDEARLDLNSAERGCSVEQLRLLRFELVRREHFSVPELSELHELIGD
nr:hypothetical protein [Nocardia pseudovaccinii]